jgi:murein DD-endopeptidase MepM/ murein hydrolase activator NlpD
MSFSSIDPTGLKKASPGGVPDRNETAVRRAATEFEAMMLSQFTAAMNPKNDEEEEGLFSSSANDMYHQMFSEEMAKSLAKNGGVGLASSLMQQLGMNNLAGASRGTQRAVEMARLVRGKDSGNNLADGLASVEKSSLLTKRPSHHSHSSSAANSPSGNEKVEIQMPLEGRISSHFGGRRDPVRGGQRHHDGIDIAAPRGTPIGAAAAGTVVFAGRKGGYGNMVEIEHADGRRTRYGHADRIMVSPGDQVGDGQTIATVGSTGRSTGPHLHFEVNEKGNSVDPLQVVAKDFILARR